jgi:hypothetical protein
MVAGRYPPGFPVAPMPSSRRRHEITDMILEDGSGAWSDDDQAYRIHVPYIRQTQGDAAANAMLAKLDKSKLTLVGE